MEIVPKEHDPEIINFLDGSTTYITNVNHGVMEQSSQNINITLQKIEQAKSTIEPLKLYEGITLIANSFKWNLN